jgi:hypothetical protein
MRVRFGVMYSRPPCCVRINRRTQSTTSPTRNHTSGPTCRLPDADTACRATRARLLGSGSSLEVSCPLQRSLAMLALSGAAGLRTIPLRRFIPTRRPARLLRAFAQQLPAGADDLHAPLRFSASSGFLAMKLTWRTLLGPWAFQPNPSLADRLRSLPRIRGARSPGVAAGRRPVALTTDVFDRACR